MWDLCFSGKPATSRNLAPARAPAANQAIRFGKTGVRIHLCRIRGGSGCRGPTNAAGAIRRILLRHGRRDARLPAGTRGTFIAVDRLGAASSGAAGVNPTGVITGEYFD